MPIKWRKDANETDEKMKLALLAKPNADDDELARMTWTSPATVWRSRQRIKSAPDIYKMLIENDDIVDLIHKDLREKVEEQIMKNTLTEASLMQLGAYFTTIREKLGSWPPPKELPKPTEEMSKKILEFLGE